MTSKQLQSELTQTDQKIRGMNQELAGLRARRSQLKAQLTEARQADMAAAAGFAPEPAAEKKPARKKGE